MVLVKKILNTFPRPWLIKLSLFFLPVADILFRGNTFTDPVNGKSYRRFLPYGYRVLRPNALSPGTLTLERHRALWLYLQRYTDFFTKPASLLHIAPEQAFYKRFKKMPHLDYTTVDLYSPIADVKADITDLPFESDRFDIVFCNHVLEHLPDDRKAMQELYRVMKPGGYGIFQIPLDASHPQTFEDPSVTDPRERAEKFGQYDHVRVYGLDFFERLQSVGFLAEAIPVRNLFTADEIRRYALDKNEIIPLVRKPA